MIYLRNLSNVGVYNSYVLLYIEVFNYKDMLVCALKEISNKTQCT